MSANAFHSSLMTADIFTSSHRFSAQISLGHRRLADVLNDRMTDFLTVENVYVSRINEPGNIIGTLNNASLLKSQITFIVVPTEEDGLSKEHKYNAFSKSVENVFVTLPSFEITGKLEIIGKFDLKAILAIGTTKFMPIFNGNAKNTFYPDVQFTAPVIIVNKTSVALFSVITKE